mmetsp:Transcript_31258/g.46220  ORF Transcript_31258/g.46220 Transcript_31258/m.46220 type:complete len:214 (+) Transcript_31258:139-780(+)
MSSNANSTAPNQLFCSIGDENSSLSDDVIKSKLDEFLSSVTSEWSSNTKTKRNVLILPPDYTRFHSQAGKITRFIDDFFAKEEEKMSSSLELTILPALGTHAPMTDVQIRSMFGDKLADKNPSPFVVHDWRNDVVTIGHAPADMVKEATGGMVNTPWPAQLNRIVWEGNHDLGEFCSFEHFYFYLVLSFLPSIPNQMSLSLPAFRVTFHLSFQ